MSYKVIDGQNGRSRRSLDSDNMSVSSRRSRVSQHPKELSEPLTADEEEHQNDPYYTFRADLMKKLEVVDECLAEFLRVVHQTVWRSRHWRVACW